MPEGLVLECPICGDQRPFDINVENPPTLLEPRLKMSASGHLEKAHDQDDMRVDQWNEIVDIMFEADIPQYLLDKIDDDDNQGPKWDDYGLR